MDSGGNVQRVSIHALLAECDLYDTIVSYSASSFNPRTPCGVRPSVIFRTMSLVTVSIHALLAECDFGLMSIPMSSRGFNPRTPCGVRHGSKCRASPPNGFQSTHSLRSATWRRCADTILRKFQSTHSLRSATRWRTHRKFNVDVSIHALLAECDQIPVNRNRLAVCFNPRTPCGVRPYCPGGVAVVAKFVSIHALLAECDGS